MSSRMQMPELRCMDPENYRKYFRSLCWSGTRKGDKKPSKKIGKKEKLRRLRAANSLTVCYAPALLSNPSQFAVYAAVRRSILMRWRHLQQPVIEISDDDDDDSSSQIPAQKLPRITGIGLKTVFALISQSQYSETQFCELALKALLDVLQGHSSEELCQEPTEIITNLHTMLVEVANGKTAIGRAELPSSLTSLSSSCLIALSVARGESELILNAVASLIMSNPEFSEQNIQIPINLTTLQRSVQSVILGAPSRNQWLNHGVPHQSLVTSFPVDLPTQLTSGSGDLVVRSLVSDGCYLYVFTSRGLIKIGSGYGSSIKQHVYVYKPDFFASDRHGWLGYCKDKLYVRIGRKKTEVFEVDKDSLEVKNVIRLETGNPGPIEPKSAVFTDGNQLGVIFLTNFDNLTIRMYDVDNAQERHDGTTTLTSRKELNVHLLRQRTMALGRAPFEDILARRSVELDSPVAMQLEDSDDDPLVGISAGQDFALLTTASGKVYYTGKTTSLGYKLPITHTSRWIVMKESVFTKNDMPNQKKCKVVQAAIGHEGLHAILVLDNGSALFTGVARRGEDGDTYKHRRNPKPVRPKKIFKAEGHHIVYAACNYGSTALVTKQGLLLMFGKDTQHCEASGVVTALRHERIVKVALGKAHAVALTNFGQVYTFGINNKGQCGREFGYARDRPYMTRRSSLAKDLCVNHSWVIGSCHACVFCREQSPTRVTDDNFICEETEICSVCSICRRCSEGMNAPPEPDDDGDASTLSDAKDDKENRYPVYEGQCSSWDGCDSSMKASCVPPARVAIPGAHRVCNVAAGLHHTILLTENGDVLTFGSNQFGQLGTGDVNMHQRVIHVRIPRAASVSAGSNHSVVLTRDGEVYTFGSYQKGSLGRPRLDDASSRPERSPIWFATPGRVPRFGPRHACKAVWVSASGDQTFVQVSQSVIKTDTLFSCTITANHNSIVILPNRPEHTFKCITINKSDGSCNAWAGPEQVDFVNSLACLDPLYDILWSYQPQMRVIKCYNIMAYDSHKISKCCTTNTALYNDVDYEYPNHGIMKRLDEFKNLENFEVMSDKDEKPVDAVALTNMSVLNQELAIPVITGCKVTRMHLALHLLGCLDSLTYAYDNKLNHCEPKVDAPCSPTVPIKGDFQTVNRFESHGGGWGYSGHSVEAIRFMCDADIVLGGFGLYGGRGDYTAKIKLFDLGLDGGEQEGDGDVIAESEEVVYECAPKDKFPLLFETPVPVVANRWYVAWACISGPSSDCGSSGQAMVINDEIGFHFKTSKKSNNGTDVNAGQIPCILYNVMSPDHAVPNRHIDPGEPIIVLTKNISRKVTVQCFKSLIKLLRWSWETFKAKILETNGQLPINYQKLTMMKHQKRLVYVIRACLRLVKSYINEIYPQNNRKRNSHEYMSYFEAIAEVKSLILNIMADDIPTCSVLPRRPGKNKAHRVCYVQFALELTNSILNEAHDTITACFHAFFPTPVLKWNQLCALLFQVQDGVVSPSQIRELTSTCAATAGAKSLRDVLHYVVPLTQKSLNNMDTRRSTVCMPPKIAKEAPAKSATVPRSSHAPKPPPVPPRANREAKVPDTVEAKSSHLEWNLLDVIPRLLDIVMIPIKQQMMTRQCGQPHDHGEMRQNQKLSEFCCKLCARIIGELCYSASNIKEDLDTNTVKHLITPSRFMRMNSSRVWNTGNGSPDAICFTVDRPGIMLVGACVYGGLGISEYTLELLHDVRQLRDENGEETEPSHCWMSVDVVNGTYSAAECQHEIAHIKFEKPVSLKEDLRYALRLCNHGGRTANGDCGLPSVKGPDGTNFKFASCSLSFNGTTLARGQIPSLIYYGTSKTTNTGESTDALILSLRTITLRIVSTILDRCAELFCTLRNELTSEDLRRNAAVLQQSPAINILVPFTLANLEGLEDSKSVIKVLEMIRKLLPQVTAMNLLIPSAEETSTTTTHYYTWVESEHPYKQASVSNMRVLFPANVSWVVLEMDPRSITAQPEDTLTVFAVAGVPKSKPCQCYTDAKSPDPPFRKRVIQLTTESGEAEDVVDDPEIESPCAHYSCTYISVTPKLANIHADWPQKAILVPGNEVIFSLETASDYLNEYNKTNNEDSRFGFRCLCAGYEDATLTSQRQGLAALEMELVYHGAACSARLLAPNLDLINYATMMDVQLSASLVPEEEGCQDGSEALFLSRGLNLSAAPSLAHVLAGLPLPRCVSTERQFLSDLVSGAESSAGGRLARWLAPTPRVEPAKCELKRPAAPPHPGLTLTLPVVIRDQYGDLVTSPALKVDVIVQKLGECESRRSRSSLSEPRRANLPNVRYSPVRRDTMCFQAITMMKAYQNYSFEELRLASGAWSGRGATSTAGAGRLPPERMTLRALGDGSFQALWTPKAPGTYVFRCTFDDIPTAQELTIEVAECNYEGPSERLVPPSGGMTSGAGVPPAPTSPSRMRLFPGTYSAGLRVRASPSLQAEEIGRVPPGSEIAFVEEVTNKDGKWVRLSAESARTFADGCGVVAWCLQHHRPLDRTLLVPVPPSPSPSECVGFWLGCGEAQGDMPSWTNDEDLDGSNADLSAEDRKFPFTITIDMESDSGSSTPMIPEPSKRTRYAQSEASASSTPRKTSRRSNGNSDEWWSPIRHRSSEDLKDTDIVLETDIEPEPPEPQPRSSGRLAQACTQTSPEDEPYSLNYYTANAKLQTDDRSSPRGRPTASRTPVAAPAPVPRKYAQSPAQAQCLRAVFAALLWHEGIVHDAIACAAFLKFHPTLGKQGARVNTRGAVAASARQRHSVEVAAAGQYLRIQPSTLETLTRSALEANASRKKESGTLQHRREIASEPSVVNVLPPALRALVALWDAMYDADQLSCATDKNRKDPIEKNENNEPSSSGGRVSFWTNIAKAPYAVQCELCGGAPVPQPIAAHMRNVHLGCRTLSSLGYDRMGQYVRVQPPPRLCGSLGQAAFQLWYVFCEQCREKCISSAAAAKPSPADVHLAPAPAPPVSHAAARANALFLLELAPLTAPQSHESSPVCSEAGGGRSPPAPAGSAWLPAPPFQCLPALGAAPRPQRDQPPRYHSLGRPNNTQVPQQYEPLALQASNWPRVHRSVSMGQAGKDLSAAARPPLTKVALNEEADALPGAGSSLLSQPSAALQKLVNLGVSPSEPYVVSALEAPRLDREALMKSPVLTFVLASRDLECFRQKLDAVVRMNTVRQYAFEALNWLLRSCTQAGCVHDVLWWFCNALDKFARLVPPPPDLDAKESGGRARWLAASTSALCPGGRGAGGSRAALHALLASVSALAPALPPAATALALQAVRCWSLHYTSLDRPFLHRSQVFSVISKILSHSEDNAYEDGTLGALHESFHSYLNKESYVWICPEVTSWCDVAVSSRQGMAGALTDGSTETFWESGDEDRNKAKWIQLTYPGGAPEDRPYILAVHIDNTRDTANKTLLLTFMYSGGTSELYHMLDQEVDPKNAAWICYTLPRSLGGPVRIRCELRGPEAAVRVRQLRVLSAPAPLPTRRGAVLHALCEADTLRVFRLLTSQVFGKLLQWEGSAGGAGSEGGDDGADDAGADCDLREHVVGILFAGHKLTSLQRQVMAHIVSAIGGEAARARDDWETALLCTAHTDKEDTPPSEPPQDNYCFEMLSMLLALSGSAPGRAHLAQRNELLTDLLTLLHTGSDRVQRQVISLLRRMIMEIPPHKMNLVQEVNTGSSTGVTLLDHLIVFVAKAITVQVKVKGSGAGGVVAATMGASVSPVPTAMWFMRGKTTKKHANLISRLLSDMAEEKISTLWGIETRSALAAAVTAVAALGDAAREPELCVAAPSMWLCLAALCVSAQDHLELINGTSGERALDADESGRGFCTNHDDGTTPAAVECRTCGALCAECDRFLHLPRATRRHLRQMVAEEEQQIRVDVHEGCGRAKLSWLLLLVERRTLKALAEFRGGGATALAGVCRFCGACSDAGLLALGNVCADPQCQELGLTACPRIHGCGHACGGVRGERTCLPCLHACGAGGGPGGTEPVLRQDADDMCMICFTDPLHAAPAIQLKCGHVFHLHCCKKVLINKWNGPRVTFSFSLCPICKEDMYHWALEELLEPINRLREEVRRKALMRLEYEGLASGKTRADPAQYAMERYAYYVCHKCEKAYFGGLARCEAESNSWWQPADLVCGACSDVAGARSCAKHGADFLEYKCRYCCSVAVFFCFGTSHFCNACHDDFQRVTNIPKHLLPQCPAGPKGEQLPGTADECPLHTPHPPTGEEFALGCGVCRHVRAF